MFSRVITLCIIAVSAGGTVEKPKEENPASYTSDTSGIYNDDKHAGQILMSSAISDDSNSYANYYTYPTQDLLEEYSKYLHMRYNDEDDPRKKRANDENENSLDRRFDIPYYDYYNNKDLLQILQKVDEDSVVVDNADSNNIRRADNEEDVVIVNAITLTTTTERTKYKKNKKGKGEQKSDEQEKKYKYKPKYSRKHKSHHQEQKNKQTGERKENNEAKIARNKYLKEQSKHTYHRKHYHHKHKEQDKKKDAKAASNETESNESLEKSESSEHLILNRQPKEDQLHTTTKRVYKSLRGDKHFATSDLSKGVKINSGESQENPKPKVQKKKKRPVKFEDQFQIVRHHHMYHDDKDENDDHHDQHHDDHDDGDDDDEDDGLDEEDIHFIQKYYKDILKNNTHADDNDKHGHVNEDQHHQDDHEDGQKHEHEHEHDHDHGHEHKYTHTHKEKHHDVSDLPETSHKIRGYEHNSIEDNDEDLEHQLYYADFLKTQEENKEPKKSPLQEIKDVLFQSGFKAVNVPVSEVIINHHHENIDHPEAYQYQLYQKQPENLKEDIRYANSYDSYPGDPISSLYQPPLGNEFFVSGEGSNPYENFLQDDNAENCDETESSHPSTSYVENVQPYAQSYNFKYGVDDPRTGDMKTHYETRDGDVVIGEYKFTEADGKVRVVKYKVDKEDGFKAVVLREENEAPATKK